MIQFIYETYGTCSRLYEDLTVQVGGCEAKAVVTIFNVINYLPDWLRFLIG
jgi:hypothetical protein